MKPNPTKQDSFKNILNHAAKKALAATLSIGFVLAQSPEALAREIMFDRPVKQGKVGISLKSFDIDHKTGVGMDIGRGYDSYKDDSAGVCVKVPAKVYDEERTPNTLQESTFRFELVESKEDLAKKLGVTTAASLKSGFSKGSVTASYVNEQKVSRYSLYVLISAEILMPQQIAAREDLDPDYVDLARTNPEAFRIKCGNEYVAAIKRGGVFYGLLRLDTEDQSSYTQLKVSLRAKVGTFKAAADLERSISEATSKRSLQIFATSIGGENRPYPTDATELIERVKNFPAEVSRSPVVIRSLTLPYAQLKSYPVGATAFDTSVQESTLDYLNQVRLRLVDHRDDLNYILGNEFQFASFQPDDLYARIDYVNGKLNEINTITKQCLNNFNVCRLPELGLTSFRLPERKNKAVVDEQCRLRTSEECGLIYKVAVNPACGIKAYKLGRAAICGVKSYNVKRSAACGVEQFNEGSGPQCGVAAYNQRKDARRCGTTESTGCHMMAPIKESWADKLAASVNYIRGGEGGGGGICRSSAKTCRHPDFGVEAYNTCRHQDFGVAQYKECADPTHEAAEFNECRVEEFGIESYNSCANVANGVDGTKQCYLKEVFDQNSGSVKLKSCSVN